MDAPTTTKANEQEIGKSFAQVLSGSSLGAPNDDGFLAKLPPKVIIGNSVRIKISQAAYESGLATCRFNLHGHLTLHKGDSPLTTQALKTKLSNLWPQLSNWSLVPLGKGFLEFHFNLIEDLSQIWALVVVNLKPRFLRFYSRTKDFVPNEQAQTHAQVWVRLMQLPQEYWGKQTLFEIASGLGSPLTIDEATQHKRFGLFARILIDVNLAEKLFKSIIVEREGHALTIMAQYEKHHLFRAHCKTIGHSVQSCSKINADVNVQKQVNKVSHKIQAKVMPVNKVVAETAFVKAPATGFKPVTIIANTELHEETFDLANDFEEGECSPCCESDSKLEKLRFLETANSRLEWCCLRPEFTLVFQPGTREKSAPEWRNSGPELSHQHILET